jgi:hypothetical protein
MTAFPPGSWGAIDWRFEPDEASAAFGRLLVDAVLFAGTPCPLRIRCRPAGEAAGGARGSLERIVTEWCGTAPDPERMAEIDTDPAGFTRALGAMDPPDALRELGALLALCSPENSRRWDKSSGWRGWRHGNGYLWQAIDPAVWPCRRGDAAAVLVTAVLACARSRAGGRKVTAPRSNPEGRREPPVYWDAARGAAVGDGGWVVDVAKCWPQIALPMGWDLTYRRGETVRLGQVPWWGCEVWARDKRLAQRVLGVIDKESSSYTAPDLWDWRMDVTHAIATEAIDDFGACYWATDGGIFPDEATAAAYAQHLADRWGLVTRTTPNDWGDRDSRLRARDTVSTITLAGVDVELLVEARRLILASDAETADQLPPLAGKDDPDRATNPKTGEPLQARSVTVVDLEHTTVATHTLQTWRAEGDPGDRLHGDPQLAANTHPAPQTGVARVRGAVAGVRPASWADNNESGWAVQLAPGAHVAGAKGAINAQYPVTVRHTTGGRPALAAGDTVDLVVTVEARPDERDERRYLPDSHPTVEDDTPSAPIPPDTAPPPVADRPVEAAVPALPPDRWMTGGDPKTYKGVAKWEAALNQRLLAGDPGTYEGETVPHAAYIAWWGHRPGRPAETTKVSTPIRVTAPHLAELVRAYLAEGERDTEVEFRQYEGLDGGGRTRVFVRFNDPAWDQLVTADTTAGAPPHPAGPPTSAPPTSTAVEARLARLEHQQRHVLAQVLAVIELTGVNPMTVAIAAQRHLDAATELLNQIQSRGEQS